MNILEDVLALEKQSKIKLDSKHKGAFTKYCKDKGYDGVTDACIKEGLKDQDPHIRKEANFARNARKWKHKK